MEILVKKKEIKSIPQISGIDLTLEVSQMLISEGYNIQFGTFGKAINIPNYQRFDSKFVQPTIVLPENLHEFDILILDLTNNISDSNFESDVKLANQQYSKKYKCSYPQTIFNSRPLGSLELGEKLKLIKKNNFIKIIFACSDYDFKYQYDIINGSSIIMDLEINYNIYCFEKLYQLGTISGTKINSCSRNKQFNTLFEKYLSGSVYHTSFYHPKLDGNVKDTNFFPLLLNCNGDIVGYYQYHLKGINIVLPDIKNKAGFLKEFLEEVAPTLMPVIFPNSAKNLWKEKDEYLLPNQAEIVFEMSLLEKEYKEKKDQISTKIELNKEKFNYLHSLLTETGDNLVNSLIDFFKFIEFQSVRNKDDESTGQLEEDIIIDHEKGVLIIEVKGIVGTSKDSECSQISKVKYRRCKERNSFDVSALYIVNHQKNQPPLERRNPPFSEDQIKDAINDERGLVTTWQIFNLYFNIQTEAISKDFARKQLLNYGLIEFHPEGFNKISNPIEILKKGTVIILELVQTKLEVGKLIYLVNSIFKCNFHIF